MKAPSMPRPFLDRFLTGPGPADVETYAGIILRDIEELLNSRRSSPLGEDGEEPDLSYGLPDLSLTGRTDGELMQLARAVRSCLEVYEPRLADIRVEALPPEPEDIDRLTVRVTAALTGYEKLPGLTLEMPLNIRRLAL